jgi:hypothetical protein
MQLSPGTRLRSAVDSTEVIVVRAPDADVEVGCGGHPMVPVGQDPPAGLSLDPEWSGGTPIGKRYANEEAGLELLCTKAGQGSLSLGGKPLELKAAKPLPASD